MANVGFVDTRFVHVNCEHSDGVITSTHEGNLEFYGVSIVGNEFYDEILVKAKKYDLVVNLTAFISCLAMLVLIGYVVAWSLTT